MKDTTPVYSDSDEINESRIQSSCNEIDTLFYEFHKQQLGALTLNTNDPTTLQNSIQKLETTFKLIQKAIKGTKEDIPSYTSDPSIQRFLEQLYSLAPNYDCEIDAYIEYRLEVMEQNNYLTPLRIHAENLEKSSPKQKHASQQAVVQIGQMS